MQKITKLFCLLYWMARRRLAALMPIGLPFLDRVMAERDISSQAFFLYDDGTVESPTISRYLQRLEEISSDVWNFSRKMIYEEMFDLKEVNFRFHELLELPPEIHPVLEKEVGREEYILNDRLIEERKGQILENRRMMKELYPTLKKLEQRVAGMEADTSILMKKKGNRCLRHLEYYLRTAQDHYNGKIDFNMKQIVHCAELSGYKGYYEGYREIIEQSRLIIRTYEVEMGGYV